MVQQDKERERITANRTITTRDNAVYLMTRTALKEGGAFVLRKKVSSSSADGVIGNTDNDYSHFTPLFRPQGMSFVATAS